jgi:serine/threonine-protein kinase
MVADFGIALAVTAAGGERLTETGLSIGTPEYMSPEQVAGERSIDARSDIYSLACVLYEMLAGQPPFTGATGQAVLARHVTDAVPPITTVRSGLAAPVAGAVTKALGKAPADRFESANAFSEALFATEVEAEEEKKSIVVVPFANRSPDAENEYFSDGLTEELIADLSRLGALRVISHNSAMRLKGTGKDTRAIGEEVGVRYVLTGGVRKAGSHVRITAHLADTMDDSEVWTGKYGGELDDIFEMQENVSQAIVGALQVSLSPAEEQGLGERSIADARAYDYYLRARQDILHLSKEGVERAIRLLQDAIAVEGENSLLLAMIGYAYVLYLKLRWTEDEDAVRDQLEECLKRLLELAPESPREHFLRGMIAYERGDMREAVSRLMQSFELDRNSPEILLWLLVCLLHVGRDRASVEPLAEHLLAIDPLTPVNLLVIGAFDMFEGRAAVGLQAVARAAEMDPSNPDSVWFHGYVLALNGRMEEAAEVAERLAVLSPDFVYTGQLAALVAAWRGDLATARACITPRMMDAGARDHHLSLHLAESYAAMGAREDALGCLRNAIERGFVRYVFFSQHNRFFENLHSDPEFIELMEQARAEWEYFGSLPIPAVEG